jgi:hypothetical protein
VDKKNLCSRFNNARDFISNICFKVIAISFCLFTFILIITSMSLTYKLVVLNEDIKDIAGFKLYKVANEDLTLSLDRGDLVIVRKVPKNKLSEGDVVTFFNGSSIASHKIDSILENKIILNKSDKGYDDKLQIEYNDVLGKYFFSISKGNFLLSVSKNPFFTFIIFLILLINISFLFRLFSVNKTGFRKK